MDRNAIGFQHSVFWGLVSQGKVIEAGVPNVEDKTFASQGKAPGFEFPPVAGAHARGGVNGQIVFRPHIPASVWVFLVCLMCRHHPSF